MRPYNSAKLLRQANPRRQLNFNLNNMTPEQTELVLLRLLTVGAPVAPRMARTAREYESVVGIDNHVGHASKDFVFLLLCCTWLDFFDLRVPEFDILDFFAGAANISKAAARAGLRAATYDIKLAAPKRRRKSVWRSSRSPMDINSDSGFVCPSISGKYMCTARSFYITTGLTVC